MYDYYCKNCNNIIGKWNNEYEYYDILSYCNFFNSKILTINFLDCINCNKFIGIECYYVCKNCFEKDLIFGEENLFNFFLKYRKSTPKYKNYKLNCKNCNKKKYRDQLWFFKELTFYK